jgi:hypothetical protein
MNNPAAMTRHPPHWPSSAMTPDNDATWDVLVSGTEDDPPDLCHCCGDHDGEYTLPDGTLLCGFCADREANPDKYPESYDRWRESAP